MTAEPRRTLRAQSAAEPQLHDVGFGVVAGGRQPHSAGICYWPAAQISFVVFAEIPPCDTASGTSPAVETAGTRNVI